MFEKEILKSAILNKLKIEKEFDSFKRECETEEEAMIAEAERLFLEAKVDVANIIFNRAYEEYIDSETGE
jgi:hypothetical protein